MQYRALRWGRIEMFEPSLLPARIELVFRRASENSMEALQGIYHSICLRNCDGDQSNLLLCRFVNCELKHPHGFGPLHQLDMGQRMLRPKEAL